MPGYSLKETATLVGVAPITLKRWLLSGRIPEVSRDRNGWRVFSEDDVRRIKTLSGEIHEPESEYASRSFRPKVASFFSGIGGFDLGFEQANFDLTLQCEINKFCQSILKQHFPNVPLYGDIEELTNATIPVSDVWIGGFPCQDVSLARMGKRDGLRGRQSGLFYKFAGLVARDLPRVVVIENVPGLLSSHKGRDFGTVIGTLAELGYSVGWRTLNSKNFGVPQSRRRIYIVGCHRDWRGPAPILFESERGEGNAAQNGSDGEESLSPFKKSIGDPRGKGPVVQSIAYCLYACSARHTGTDWSRTYVPYPKLGKVRRLTPTECEGVMGFPKGWTIPSVPNVAPDIDSARYHALGNAVTPATARWLGERVRAYLLAAKGKSEDPVALKQRA